MKTRTTKRTMWTLLLGLAIAVLSMQSKAQDALLIGDVIDLNNSQDIGKLPKMDRDILIMENVLADIFKKKSSSFNSTSRTRGLYIPGNGVIFNVSGNGIFYGSDYVAWGDLVEVVSVGQASVVSTNFTEEELKKFNEEKKKKIAEQAKTFLADYGSLLGELKDNEKIQVSVNYTLHVQSSSRKIDGQLAFVSSSRDENKRRMTAEISVRDLKAYTAGSISQSEVFSRIKTNSYDINEDEMLDAKILAGIFDDVFRVSYDGYLKRRGATSWTYFEGFGLMFNVNLSSSGNNYSLVTSNGVEVITRRGEDDKVNADDFYKGIQAKYQEFESMVKEQLVKYGRTLRSLQPNEVVIINMGLSANKRSGLPNNIQFMIPKSEIDAFTKGNKSLNQVMDAVNMKKLKASLGSSSYYGVPGSESLVYQATAPGRYQASSVNYATTRAAERAVLREATRVAERNAVIAKGRIR